MLDKIFVKKFHNSFIELSLHLLLHFWLRSLIFILCSISHNILHDFLL